MQPTNETQAWSPQVIKKKKKKNIEICGEYEFITKLVFSTKKYWDPGKAF